MFRRGPIRRQIYFVRSILFTHARATGGAWPKADQYTDSGPRRGLYGRRDVLAPRSSGHTVPDLELGRCQFPSGGISKQIRCSPWRGPRSIARTGRALHSRPARARRTIRRSASSRSRLVEPNSGNGVSSFLISPWGRYDVLYGKDVNRLHGEFKPLPAGACQSRSQLLHIKQLPSTSAFTSPRPVVLSTRPEGTQCAVDGARFITSNAPGRSRRY